MDFTLISFISQVTTEKRDFFIEIFKVIKKQVTTEKDVVLPRGVKLVLEVSVIKKEQVGIITTIFLIDGS